MCAATAAVKTAATTAMATASTMSGREGRRRGCKRDRETGGADRSKFCHEMFSFCYVNRPID
jgi:hypothetical protein